jgi:hypothetical protein
VASVREAGYAVPARNGRRRSPVVVALNTGVQTAVELAFRTRLAEGLAGASHGNLADTEISPAGLGLHWRRLDADLCVPALLHWKSVSTNISAASVATMAASNGVLAAIGRSDWGFDPP